MAEYINREIAKRSLRMNQHRFTCADEANGFGSVKWSEDVIYANAAQKAIDTIPSADVQPVVHGEWVSPPKREENVGYRNGFGIYYECSRCGYIEDWHTNFCPYCGADMRSNAQVMPSKDGGT